MSYSSDSDSDVPETFGNQQIKQDAILKIKSLKEVEKR
jgi:hypothetical protein